MRDPIISVRATRGEVILSRRAHFGKNPKNGGMPPRDRRITNIKMSEGERRNIWDENFAENELLVQAVRNSGIEIIM